MFIRRVGGRKANKRQRSSALWQTPDEAKVNIGTAFAIAETESHQPIVLLWVEGNCVFAAFDIDIIANGPITLIQQNEN